MRFVKGVGTAVAAGWIAGLLTGCAAQSGPSGDGMRVATEKVEATAEAVEQALVDLARSQREVAQQWQSRTFEEFEATVYREPDGGKYIVDGDTPIVDRKHLEEFFETKVQKPAGPLIGGLIVNTSGGVDTAWDDATKRSLVYCVSSGFGSRHGAVVNAMRAATGAWEAVADIDFVYSPSQDSNCTATNAQVLFDVRPVSGARYLARAFFPDDARGARNVLINDSSFGLDPNGNLSLEGILRHELGHALGFRHEHTRPNAGTCFEDTNWRPLTAYDAFSVMHYPQCNGAGDWSLTLTRFDRSGAACLYGAAQGFSPDPNICTLPVQPPPPAGCGPQVVTESGSVVRSGVDMLGPYEVTPGSEFKAAMSGTGDPDLYVRFDQAPTISSYDCRPYLSGAIEKCELTVPPGKTRAFVMVRGYRAGTYQLTVEHTPGP